jgi:DNA topoisomerase-1
VLRANGSTLVKPGYIAVYKEGVDDGGDDDNDRILPPLAVGDGLKLLGIRPEQHFTEPPPRYSEASLVKALEEHGIGRPSTYASIISTLVNKKYTELLNRRFVPTDLGKIVNRFLTRNFHHYVEYGFTAKMEDDLDEIADGHEAWVPVLDRFWKEFKQRLDHVDDTVTREDVSEARELGKDPTTRKPISVRYGKYGPFVQMGTKDDEEKPKFASLRPHQRMDTITLPEALELFKLPRTVGNMPDGHAIRVAIGRFGPYVQYGAKKFVSIKAHQGLHDPPQGEAGHYRARAGERAARRDRYSGENEGAHRVRHRLPAQLVTAARSPDRLENPVRGAEEG